jgi:hypothetical protein
VIWTVGFCQIKAGFMRASLSVITTNLQAKRVLRDLERFSERETAVVD